MNLLYLSKILLFLLVNVIIYSNQTILFNEANSFSLNSVKIVSGNNDFYPCNSGGVAVINKGIVYYPWSEGIEFLPLNIKRNGREHHTEWIMIKKNEFYYHYQIDYELYENKGIIRAKDLGKLHADDTLPSDYAEIYGFYLDRCENAINPVIIGVPYLTTFNILLANNCFVSIYFDWDKTHCSQIIPYCQKYSATSVYYSQFALYNPLTNGKRNKLDETVILKVSNNIDDVFPDINNPVSVYKSESSKRIIFDDWLPFNSSLNRLNELKAAGINNIWHILHDWQKNGYDVSLPDVYPANHLYGGNAELIKISEFNKENNNLFGVHENYMDVYKASSYYYPLNLALNSQGNYKFNWYTSFNNDSSFLIKPDKIFDILVPISATIHQSFGTTSVFHDVASSYDPSKFVDYDHRSKSSGKFRETYNVLKSIPDTLRRIHAGPVSGEGLAHFLYVGYYDDICAQMHTAKSLPGSYYGQSEKEGGFYKPLLVNFDLLRLKDKASVHGMGYYERFFYKDYYWKFHGRGNDSALMYAATELAYAHSAFFTTDTYNLIEQAKIEYGYVYPMQVRYSDLKAISILYNDNGELLSASDYIRKYPSTFDDFYNTDFMAQLYVEYDNGLTIFVNRHPTKRWDLSFDRGPGYYNFHASKNNNDESILFQGETTGGNFRLPQSNGWLCYSKN